MGKDFPAGARLPALLHQTPPRSLVMEGGRMAPKVSTTHKPLMKFERDLFKNRTKESFGISKPNNHQSITRKLKHFPGSPEIQNHRSPRAREKETMCKPEDDPRPTPPTQAVSVAPGRHPQGRDRNHRQDSLSKVDAKAVQQNLHNKLKSQSRRNTLN